MCLWTFVGEASAWIQGPERSDAQRLGEHGAAVWSLLGQDMQMDDDSAKSSSAKDDIFKSMQSQEFGNKTSEGHMLGCRMLRDASLGEIWRRRRFCKIE